MWTERWSASAPIPSRLHSGGPPPLRAKGIKLFLATGRHQAMLRPFRELFPFDGCVPPSAASTASLGTGAPQQPHAAGGGAEELVAAAERGTPSPPFFLEGRTSISTASMTRPASSSRICGIPMPPVRPARYALGREIYQAVTFLSREQEHLLLDRAPHLKTTRWLSLIFWTSSRPPEERIWEWMPFWTTSASRWKTAWPLATEKTTCPC